MAQKTDIYSVMYSYAKKEGSPIVDMEPFLDFLGKYSRQMQEKKPEWAKWTTETGKKAWMDINSLVEEEKLEIDDSRGKPKVIIKHYYAELVKEGYRNADDDSDIPLPNEDSLKIVIPEDKIKPLYVPQDLLAFFSEPQREVLPIIRLLFPSNAGNALILAPMILSTLVDFSLLKIRAYLLRHGNREYIQHKLTPQLAGKETQLRDILDQISIRPVDCLNDLKKFRDVSFLFWGHFCTMVRTELSQKTELLAEDIAALQAVYIMDTFNGYMKKRAARTKETEYAFKNFELEMDKPPFYFSREAIMRFTDNKGVPLVKMCGQEALDAYIKKRSTEPSNPNELPDYVFFRLDDGATWLVKKTRAFFVCGKLLSDTRPIIAKAIYNRWKIMLKEYRKEAAMEDNNEFERLVTAFVKEYAPLLQTLLNDNKLPVIYAEMAEAKKGVAEASRIFNKNELQPYRVLLNLKRKQVLNDVKFLLPFWQMIFFELIAFFKRGGKKKKAGIEEDTPETAKKTKEPYEELRVKAKETGAKLVPSGHTLDSYLKDVSHRWVELINKQAYEALIEDVNSLIRDKLRSLLRIKRNSLGVDAIDTMAYTIIDSSSGLRKVRDQSSLLLYIKLYIIKLFVSKGML
jgi:hypothetical protein